MLPNCRRSVIILSCFGRAQADFNAPLMTSAEKLEEIALTASPPLSRFFSKVPAPALHVMAVTIASSAALAALTTVSQAESGQPGCGQRDRMVKHLETTYGEVRQGGGLQSATGLMELYVSDGGSWTLLLTRPDGTSCPVAVGEAWRQDGPAAPKGEKPA